VLVAARRALLVFLQYLRDLDETTPCAHGLLQVVQANFRLLIGVLGLNFPEDMDIFICELGFFLSYDFFDKKKRNYNNYSHV